MLRTYYVGKCKKLPIESNKTRLFAVTEKDCIPDYTLDFVTVTANNKNKAKQLFKCLTP